MVSTVLVVEMVYIDGGVVTARCASVDPISVLAQYIVPTWNMRGICVCYMCVAGILYRICVPYMCWHLR